MYAIARTLTGLPLAVPRRRHASASNVRNSARVAARAVRMYAKCGFVEEARLRQRSFKEGQWVDHLVMSVSREDFAKAKDAWQTAEPVTT